MIRSICLLLVMLLPTLAGADLKDKSVNEFGVGVADVDWTVAPKYPGTKLLLDGRYSLSPEVSQPISTWPGGKTYGNMVEGQFQIGDSDVGLDYYTVAYTWQAGIRDRELENYGRFQTVQDQLEWGKLLFSKDDNLGIRYYAELTAGRIGRAWAWSPSANSNWVFTVGINGSIGWAWADSEDPVFSKVSNPTLGVWNLFVLEHKTIGRFYTDARAVTGFTFGEPKSTTSREANARFGYMRDLTGCLALDVFGEKRSFHFAAFDIPDRYTKARRIGVALNCSF